MEGLFGMNLNLRKGDGYTAEGGKKPGEPLWLPTDRYGIIRPLIRCVCGELVGIPKHHVHADGRVTASFLHDGPGPFGEPSYCGWHIYATLIGWDHGDSPALE
jgi:hypothetical protein